MWGKNNTSTQQHLLRLYQLCLYMVECPVFNSLKSLWMCRGRVAKRRNLFQLFYCWVSIRCTGRGCHWSVRWALWSGPAVASALAVGLSKWAHLTSGSGLLLCQFRWPEKQIRTTPPHWNDRLLTGQPLPGRIWGRAFGCSWTRRDGASHLAPPPDCFFHNCVTAATECCKLLSSEMVHT